MFFVENEFYSSQVHSKLQCNKKIDETFKTLIQILERTREANSRINLPFWLGKHRIIFFKKGGPLTQLIYLRKLEVAFLVFGSPLKLWNHWSTHIDSSIGYPGFSYSIGHNYGLFDCRVNHWRLYAVILHKILEVLNFRVFLKSFFKQTAENAAWSSHFWIERIFIGAIFVPPKTNPR